MAHNPGFQLSVDVTGRTCVVIGGDDDAADKVHRLLEAGAKVMVVSPTLNDALKKLTASAKILHRVRRFRETDAQGAVLIVNTLKDDDAFSRSLLELANKERFLLCSIDQPDASNAMLPAVVRQGHLRVAVSTSGVAPALASRIRQDLALVFGEEMAQFLDWLAALRDETKQNEPDAQQRRATLRQAVEGFKLTGRVEYPPAWIERKNLPPAEADHPAAAPAEKQKET
jgi:precorrin-2 dehydrogenase/sirohydrochlorin ferrochelatase